MAEHAATEQAVGIRCGRVRPHRMLLGGGCLVGLVLLVGAALLASAPSFYSGRSNGRLGPSGGATAQHARRLITKLSALHAGMQRPGRWEAAITEAEINAWLATDLPANHASFLPAGWTTPRVELLPDRCRAGVRLSLGLCSTVAWIDARVQLREVNQLVITVDEARLGALPVPSGPILRSLARQLTALGMLPQSRRLDGRMALVVYIPPNRDAGAVTSRWLEALAVGRGELLLSGETRGPAASGPR